MSAYADAIAVFRRFAFMADISISAHRSLKNRRLHIFKKDFLNVLPKPNLTLRSSGSLSNCHSL